MTARTVFCRSGMICMVLLVVLAFSLVYAGEPEIKPVKTVPPPKYWDHYLVMVWQFQTNVLRDQDKYRELNIHGFHIDRRNSQTAAFSKENKWLFYVDHAADKGYLYLNKNNQKKVRDQEKKSRGIIHRPNSLADPAVMANMKNFLDKNIPAAKGAYPVGYALDDEISLGSFCFPVEVDGSPHSTAGYRKWLKEVYDNDIKKLNEQYGTNYTDFDSINPKSYESFRRGINPTNIGKLNLSQWCDWRSYMDTQFAEVIGELVRHANSLDPNVPCGFVGGQGPTAFGGYDWRKLCKTTQWCEAYSSGDNNEIIRSFWGQKRPLLKTYFQNKSNHEHNIWVLWYFMVHGNRGIICWPAGWFPGDGIAPHIKKLADTFKEIQGPVSKLIIDGEFQYDPVAIYYSHPSIQVTWCLDSVSHGKTWPNRSSSMDNNLSTSHISRMGWKKALEDIGIQAKYVHKDHLIAGELQKQGFKILILNHTLCLSDEEAEAIKKFAASGGSVVADYMCGIFDEHGKARDKGVLDDIFGVSHNMTKGIFTGKTCTEIDCEKGYRELNMNNWEGSRSPQFKDVGAAELGLTVEDGKPVAKPGGVPVVVKKGRNIYLNFSPVGYYLKRGKNEAKEFPVFLKKLMAGLGVTAPIEVLDKDGGRAHITEPIIWKNGDTFTLCVVRNLSMGSSVTSMGSVDSDIGKGKTTLKLKFRDPIKEFTNARTGKKLGNGKEFEDEFTPWEANVYTFKR